LAAAFLAVRFLTAGFLAAAIPSPFPS
jgi:hypothetical protein